MRNSKRALAGVAAGALALGMLTIASAPVASAQPSVKPKAAVTGSVTAVRATQTPESPTWTVGNIDLVPYAMLSWTSSAALAGTETAVVTLQAAPAAAAQVGISSFADIGTTAVTNGSGALAGNDLSGALELANASRTLAAGNISAGAAVAAGGTAYLGVGVTQPGTYRLTISVRKASDGSEVDSVSVSFTTTGKPSSVVFTPASQTTAVNAPAPLSVAVLDAGGNPTQLSTVTTNEYVVLSSATGGTPSFKTATSLANSTPTALTSNTLYGNSAVQLGLGATTGLTYANASAGSYTLSADPEGVIGTLTTRSATVLVSGSIASTAVDYAQVTVPVLAVNGAEAISARTVTVPAGSSTITMAVADLTGTLANSTVRFKAVPSAGTANGSSTAAYSNVTLNNAAEGSVSFTLAGGALTAGATLTITQVDATNAAISGFQVTVTQATPAVSGDTIVLQPSGAVTAALGSQVKVAAAVLNQFDQPQANYTVRIYRTSISAANLVSTGTTGADGVAQLTVTNAASATSGATETYVTQVQSPGGAYTTGTTYASLSVTYTTAGTIATVSAITNPASTVNQMPVVLVPTDGLVNTAVTGSTYTISTDTLNSYNLVTEVFTFTPLTSPATNVVITAPEGAKMSTTAPNSVAKAWDGGSTTLTVPSGTTIYAWTTKIDVNEFTMVPYGQTTPSATVKVLALNQESDGFTLTATPSSVEIATLAFATVKVSIKDIFGNPVAFSDFSYTAEGPFLVGNEQTASWYTDAFGERSIVLNTLRDQGAGKLTIKGGATNTAWAPGYVKPPRVTADPVRTAEVAVKVTDQANKSIAIVGSRGTVSGKPGIVVDGTTTGLAGKTVIPYVRFPGGEYTQGTARPKVSATGDFQWSRKTGKKAYVYFTSDDGTVSSNRIIIAAS